MTEELREPLLEPPLLGDKEIHRELDELHPDYTNIYRLAFHDGMQTGSKAQRRDDIKWMKKHCYRKAERELPENPYEPPFDKTQEIWRDIVEARTKQMLKEVDGVAFRACEEFKDA